MTYLLPLHPPLQTNVFAPTGNVGAKVPGVTVPAPLPGTAGFRHSPGSEFKLGQGQTAEDKAARMLAAANKEAERASSSSRPTNAWQADSQMSAFV